MTIYTENWTPEKQKQSNLKWRRNHPERKHGYDKEYRERNAEQRNNQQKTRQLNRRLMAIKLLGGQCLICGNNKEEKLVIHKKDCQCHRGTPASKLALKRPGDFVLLCHSPCHKGVHFLFEKLNKPWSWVESEIGVEVEDE